MLWSLASLHHLQKLNLSHCPNLENVSDLSLPPSLWSVEARLVELKLSSSFGCRRPRFTWNDMPALEHFDMSNTPSLVIEDIAMLLRSAPNLRVVKLLSCVGLVPASLEDCSVAEGQPCRRQDPNKVGGESCNANDPNGNAKPNARLATPTLEPSKDDRKGYPGCSLAHCLPPYLQHLSVGWGFELRRQSSLGVLPDCLSTIELGVGAVVSDEGLMALGSSCRRLRTIKLTMLALSETVLARVFQSLPYLQSVDMKNCVLCLGDALLVSLQEKPMTRLCLVGQSSFSKTGIRNFLSHTARQSIQELVMKFIPQESIPGLAHGLKDFRSINASRLRLLELESSSSVGCSSSSTSAGLQTITATEGGVVATDDNNNVAWRGEECYLPGLETLSLRHVCVMHVPSMVKWIESCPRLSRMVIDGCDIATDKRSTSSAILLIKSAFAHLEIQRVQVVVCKRGLLNNRFDSEPADIFGE